MTPNTEVVCIDDSGNTKLVKNNIYKVLATRASKCDCGTYDVYVGLDNEYCPYTTYTYTCSRCGKKINDGNDNRNWHRATRFVPIDSISISEAYEVLEKEPFEL